jgi:hypothetical protein
MDPKLVVETGELPEKTHPQNNIPETNPETYPELTT